MCCSIFFLSPADFSFGLLSSQNTRCDREDGSKGHSVRSSAFCHRQQDGTDRRQPVPFLPYKALRGLLPVWLSLSQRTCSLLPLTFICGRPALPCPTRPHFLPQSEKWLGPRGFFKPFPLETVLEVLQVKTWILKPYWGWGVAQW